MRFVFAALLFIFAVKALGAKIELRVQEFSTVRSGEAVQLGQIVNDDLKTSLDNRFYNVVIHEPLAAEEERTLSAEGLSKTLRQKLSFQDLQSLTLKIPEKIIIKAQRNFISQKDIAREILQRAQDLCMGCDAEIDEINLPKIKGNGEILQVKIDTQNYRGGGSFLLPMHVVTSQGNFSYWLTGKVSLYKTAAVATRLIQIGERIAESDIQYRRVNVSLSKDAIAASKEIVGRKAGRTLAMGQTIFTGDLKKELAIQRGQVVKIVLGDEAFEVAISGVAEESGSVGDLVKVKNSENQKMLSGILIEPGVVKVN